MVFFSDEDDSSTVNAVSFVDDLWSQKELTGADDLVRVYSIVGDAPSGCGGTGGAIHGSRYLAATQRAGGLFRSICSSSLNGALVDIANDVFKPSARFPLTYPVSSASSVVVKVDGVTQVSPANYSVDSSTHTIVFAAGSVPTANAVVTVTYLPVCTP